MPKKLTKESHKPHMQSSKSLLESLDHLSGKLDFTATNDYMFRAVIQSSEEARNGLLSALLNIPIEEIISSEVLNPIILGESINEKTIILDIKVLLNDNQVINLEMQVTKQDDWIERTLFYVCKNFVKLKQGKPYKDLLPFIHIGILDFSPFPANKQLYSEYLLTEKKLNQIYSDKISIRMLNLTQIENVTEEERQTDLYKWVQLFKATTWEELNMIAKNDSSISEFAHKIYEMSEDDRVWEQCLAREMYDHDRASAIAVGIEQGIAQGIEQGIKQGRNQINELHHLLIQAKRFEDLERSTTDSTYQAQLLKEFGLQQ